VTAYTKEKPRGFKIWDVFAYTTTLVTGRAFLLMLTLGILHSEWQVVPAFGFWACLAMSMTLWGLVKR
jgi:hypothetical protein